MTADEPPPRDPKTRRAWSIAAIGTLIIGGGFTLLVALQGSGGRAGLATLLLGASVSCALGALYATGTALIDTLRKRPVETERIVAGVALFVLGAALPGMLVAIGG